MGKKAKRPEPASAAPGQIRLPAFLHSVYSKVPVLPFLDRQTSTIFFLAIAAYFSFVAFVFFSSPSEISPQLFEGPLEKNAQLQLLPGERYSYSVFVDGRPDALGYSVFSSPDCNGVVVLESETRNALCLSKTGNLADPFFPPVNSSFGNQSILLFSPWMLAASDDFSWQVKTSVPLAGSEIAFSSSFNSLGSRQIGGRQAYAIQVESELGDPLVFYIDKEKRVLLLAESGNFSARLVQAPFELNWSNSQN